MTLNRTRNYILMDLLGQHLSLTWRLANHRSRTMLTAVIVRAIMLLMTQRVKARSRKRSCS